MTQWKRWLLGVAVGAVGVLSTTPAQAQYPGQLYGPPGIPGPAVSPYLSLSRSFNGGGGLGTFGGNPALNYYGFVRPQFAFRNALFGLQNQVTGLGTAFGQGGFADPYGFYATGHFAVYNNLSHYYYFPLTGYGGSYGTGYGRPGFAGGGAVFGQGGTAIGALQGRGGFGLGGGLGGVGTGGIGGFPGSVRSVGGIGGIGGRGGR
jgi:hypothetical protein